MRILISAFAAALLVPAPAFAHGTQTSSGDTAKPASNKKICRTAEGTGSIFRKRVCHTQAEWDAIADHSKTDLERTREIQDNHTQWGHHDSGG